MSSHQPPSPAAATDLDARYGRTPARARQARVFQIVAAALFVAIFAAWVVWGGLLGAPAAQFEAKDTAHTIVSESETSVTWEFSVAPGTAARCAVQALNSTFAIVGWKVVDVPASEQYTRVLTESVLTTEQAVSGLIYRCWLA